AIERPSRRYSAAMISLLIASLSIKNHPPKFVIVKHRIVPAVVEPVVGVTATAIRRSDVVLYPRVRLLALSESPPDGLWWVSPTPHQSSYSRRRFLPRIISAVTDLLRRSVPSMLWIWNVKSLTNASTREYTGSSPKMSTAFQKISS